MSKIEEVQSVLNNGENWMQGDLSDGEGNFCMLGALEEVATTDEYDKAVAKMTVAIETLFPERKNNYNILIGGNAGMIAGFNDDEDTTWEDVNLVLKHASKAE